jgi:hypothetical protein
MTRRRRKRTYSQHQLTEEQKLALIPAGPVPAAQACRVEVETVALGNEARVLITRQVVSTPVRRLLAAGCITVAEETAAARFRDDYEAAYEGSRNPLERVQVDGQSGGGDIHGAMFHKVRAAMRFDAAEHTLGPHLTRILRQIVLQEVDAETSRSFAAIGAEMAPNVANSRLHHEIGRGAAIIALQQLAWVYGRGMRQRRNKHR